MAKQIGKGTVLAYSSDGGTTWHAIAQITDVDHPDTEATEVNTDTFDASTLVEQTQAGWINAGMHSATILYDQSQSAAIYGLRYQALKWKVTYPDSSGFGYDGWIKKFGGEIPLKNLIKNKVSIKLTSEPAPFGD